MRRVRLELFAFAAESGGVSAVHISKATDGWYARVYDMHGRQYVIDKIWKSQASLEDELRESFHGRIDVF